MSRNPARAMYHQFEDTLNSMTQQLRSAIQADARMPSAVNARSDPLHRASGWARQVSGELSAVLLDTLGIAATIEWHVRQFQKCTGIVCELTVSDAACCELPEDCAALIFGIYSEALSNVARHAGASRVAIALTITPHDIVMVVRDNGSGLDGATTAPGGGGLAAIRTCSREHHGFCEIASVRNAGTTVTVSLPIA